VYLKSFWVISFIVKFYFFKAFLRMFMFRFIKASRSVSFWIKLRYIRLYKFKMFNPIRCLLMLIVFPLLLICTILNKVSWSTSSFLIPSVIGLIFYDLIRFSLKPALSHLPIYFHHRLYERALTWTKMSPKNNLVCEAVDCEEEGSSRQKRQNMVLNRWSHLRDQTK
jgi:hypothetical protein